MHIVDECFRVAYKSQEVLTRREHFSSPPVFSGSVLLIFSDFCVVLLCVFAFWVPCCDVRYDFRIKTTFGSFLPPVVCRRGSCHIYVICVCLRIVVSNTYFVLFLFGFVFLPLVYSMLPVSLDCIFLIASSVFSNVYFYLIISRHMTVDNYWWIQWQP